MHDQIIFKQINDPVKINISKIYFSFQFPDPDIPELNLHRRANVDLHSKLSRKTPVDSIIIQNFAHHDAINKMLHAVAFNNSVAFVPIAFFNK